MHSSKSSESLRAILQLVSSGGLISLITFNFLPPETSVNVGSDLALRFWPRQGCLYPASQARLSDSAWPCLAVAPGRAGESPGAQTLRLPMAQLIRRIHRRFQHSARKHVTLQTWDRQVGGGGRPPSSQLPLHVHTRTQTHTLC